MILILKGCFFINYQKPSTIKLVDISFKNIRGTSGNKDAVKLLCSKAHPCKAPIEVTLQGTVKADGNAIQGKEKWVVFGNIDGFKLNGGGAFDGEGNAAWRVNNCHKTFECKKLPIVSFSVLNSL